MRRVRVTTWINRKRIPARDWDQVVSNKMEDFTKHNYRICYNVGRSRLRRQLENKSPASTTSVARILEYVLFIVWYSSI